MEARSRLRSGSPANLKGFGTLPRQVVVPMGRGGLGEPIESNPPSIGALGGADPFTSR